jgi:hypothetical protein
MHVSDYDPLVKVNEVWRRVDVCALAERFGDAAKECNDGSLAIRTGDMHDRRQALFRPPERGEQSLNALE